MKKRKGAIMAQFRGTVKGNRSQASRLGYKTTGFETECNGWTIGVRCIARYNKEADRDEIEIWETYGSDGGGVRRHLHTVY